MSRMPKATDADVRRMLNTQFSIILGENKPVPKKRDMSEEDKQKWFENLTFVHFIGFRLAFNEAKERGILNPAEMAMGEELMEILFG